MTGDSVYAASRLRRELEKRQAYVFAMTSAFLVRYWDGWYRHVSLSLAAYAFLAVIRAREALKGGALTSSS